MTKQTPAHVLRSRVFASCGSPGHGGVALAGPRSRARSRMAPSRCTRCRRPTSAAAAGGWRLGLVGGVGVGGIGLSTIEATGEVYNLRDLGQFPGTYGQARYGFAIGTASGGDLWLQNEAGVILHLKAKRKGLMLSLGGDAVVISMRQ